MNHRSRRNVEYATAAKRGFLPGVALFALGAAGEVLGHTVFEVPALADLLFFGMEVAGVGIGLLAPVVFGAVLPLTE